MRSTAKALCSIVLLGLATSLWAADLFVGTWKLDVEKTRVITGLPPKEGNFTLTAQGDHYVVEESHTFGDGTHTVVRSTEPIDGGPVIHSEGGPLAEVSEIVKRINSRTREYTQTRAGKVILTAQLVVGKDGKTITMHLRGTNAQDKPFDRVEVWERQ